MRPWTSPTRFTKSSQCSTECSLSFAAPQQLGLEECMIPTKIRLTIKQYIRHKSVRWGIKSFLLCEAKTGYILDAEIYTGRVKDHHWPFLRSAGSVVRHLVENSQVTNKNHMLFMDSFYNSITLFHLLKNELGVLAADTVMPSHKHYTKELGRRLPKHGRYEFWCWGAITWKDRKPIHFLSNYHNPRRASTVNSRVVDRLAQLTASQLVVDCTRQVSPRLLLHECSASGYSFFASHFRYMGAMDKNDQIEPLNKTRRHYCWSRRLFMKFLIWASYNAYIIIDSYRPHCAWRALNHPKFHNTGRGEATGEGAHYRGALP